MNPIIRYEITASKRFLERYRKNLDRTQQKIIDKKILELETSPFRGKPLFAIHPHLYELYAGSYRIYYLVERTKVKIILIAYEHKNNQQKILNKIKNEAYFNKLKEENF